MSEATEELPRLEDIAYFAQQVDSVDALRKLDALLKATLTSLANSDAAEEQQD